MNVKDIKNLFERIKKHYNNFGYDDAKVTEWYRFLKDYTPESIYDSFDKYLLQEHDQPPLITALIRNAQKTNEPVAEPVYIQCELCGELILVGEDWNVFEKHHRKCAKIDFINTMSLRTKKKPINKQEYYNMTDEELEKAYRPIMDYYLKTPKGNIVKKLEEF